jgi:hypothetical protein
MRSTIFGAVVAASLLSSGQCLPNQPRDDASPKVVSLAMQRKSISNPLERDGIKRRGAQAATLDNEVSVMMVCL